MLNELMNVYLSDTQDHFHSKRVPQMPVIMTTDAREAPLIQISRVGVTQTASSPETSPGYTDTSRKRQQGKQNNLPRYRQTLGNLNCKQLCLTNLYLLAIHCSSLKGDSGRRAAAAQPNSVMQIGHVGPQRLQKCAPRTAPAADLGK